MLLSSHLICNNKVIYLSDKFHKVKVRYYTFVVEGEYFHEFSKEDIEVLFLGEVQLASGPELLEEVEFQFLNLRYANTMSRD